MFNTPEILNYCETVGVYELYKEKGNVITYYSYFGNEGLYKVVRNCKTGKETRTHLKYKKIPKFLITPNGTRYNYFCG